MKEVLQKVLLSFLALRIQSLEVDTDKGTIRGQTVSVLGKDVDVFYKIPYAKPPIGNLRFKYPEPPDAWKPDVKDGRNPAPTCAQAKFPVFFPEGFRQVVGPYSEDCLYLTVVKPSNNTDSLAVMVWIHGGGFVIGSPRSIVTEGYIFAAKGNVIVVSIGYRLGAFGFAYLGSSTIPGNMGLMDQLLALQWVKKNIPNFGGDPNKVTIFGESAGGVSVGMHLLSPLSRDLFHRAILQSGSAISPWSSLTTRDVKAGTNQLAAELRCNKSDDLETEECLREADAQDVLRAQLVVMRSQGFTTPVVDGYFLPNDSTTLLANTKYNKKSIMIGTTRDDASVFLSAMLMPLRNVTAIPRVFEPTDLEYDVFLNQSATSGKLFPIPLQDFYRSLENSAENITRVNVLTKLQTDADFGCPAATLGAAYAKTNDVYAFRFDHQSSLCPFPKWMGVPHTYDIEYAFGFTLNNSVGFTQEEKELGRTMMAYWTNFAKTGNPNFPQHVHVHWPKYNKDTMYYQALNTGNKLVTKEGLLRHECAFINDILPMITTERPPQKTMTQSCVNGGIRTAEFIPFFVLTFVLICRSVQWN